MNTRIVLVGPEYQQNIGYCCRVMKNFGFDELFIVDPACKIGQEAVKYSKHAADVLKRARIAKNLEEATKGCSLIVGTTAIVNTGRDILRECITLEEFARKMRKSKANIALLMGREGTGLSREELEKCGVVVKIESNSEYGTLNLSHALAIILYELSKDQYKPSVEFMDANEMKLLQKYFNSFVDKNRKGIRSPSTIKLAFKRIINRGIKSRVEARALLHILKKI